MQTGTHRRIVFGEAFGDAAAHDRSRDAAPRGVGGGATSSRTPVDDGRVPIWEKFIFLASLAGFTGAARLPIGPVWGDEFTQRAVPGRGCREIERVARAEGVPVAADVVDRITHVRRRASQDRCGRRC